MFKIGDFSRLSTISIRMLRYFDQVGLLKPLHVNPTNGYRYYGSGQLAVANTIKQLQNFGFSLSQINQLLTNKTSKSMEEALDSQLDLIEKKLAELHTQATLIKNAKITLAQKAPLKNFHVVKKILPSYPMISLTKVLATYEDEELLWQEFSQLVDFKYITTHYQTTTRSLYHDLEYTGCEMTVEVQLLINNLTKATFNYDHSLALEVASVTFNGPYEQMTEVTLAIAAWLEAYDYQLAGPMFNIYHRSFFETTDPHDLITEACFPIAPLVTNQKG